MSDTAEIPLAQRVILDILNASLLLRGIPAAPFIADDYDDKPEVALTVKSDMVGRSISILSDYQVTITLDRAFRQGGDVSDYEKLWKAVVAQFDNWLPVFMSLPVRSEIAHITIDDIEPAAESDVVGEAQIRSLTFLMFLQPY